MFRLEIKTANAAFDPDPCGEIARLLRDAADRIERGFLGGTLDPLIDVNGNRVGSYVLERGLRRHKGDK